MSDQVANPADLFSHNKAHLLLCYVVFRSSSKAEVLSLAIINGSYLLALHENTCFGYSLKLVH